MLISKDRLFLQCISVQLCGDELPLRVPWKDPALLCFCLGFNRPFQLGRVEQELYLNTVCAIISHGPTLTCVRL